MTSAFIGPSIGICLNVSVDDAAIRRFNAIRRRRPRYIDTASAMEVLGTTKKKLSGSERGIQDHLCVMFE